MATDYVSLGREAKGNHARFDSFGWHSAPDDREEFAICTYKSRDSDTLEQANAEAIEEAMAEHEADDVCWTEEHNHWAVGWVGAYVIRVFEPGTEEPTAAFKAWCDLQSALSDYPVLDEERFSNLEWQEAHEAWGNLRMRDRIGLCKEARVSIFASRRDEVPSDDGGRIFERLTTM